MSSPLPTTPNDIILLSLKVANVVGVGQTPTAEDLLDSFNLLNMMIAQWQRKRYMVYALTTTSLQATGALNYTVGPGGDFDIPHPAKLESAYFTQNVDTPLPVDFPLRILRAKEDYNRIGLKNLISFPQYAFLDTQYPTSYLYVWPLPSNAYRINITVMEQIESFQTPSDIITLPPEYQAALMWNLAIECCTMYGLEPSNSLVAKALDSLRTIRDTNAQIPILLMPVGLQSSAGTYNIMGDTYVGTVG